DEDIQAIVSDEALDSAEYYRLLFLKVCSETGETPMATVKILDDGIEKEGKAEGGGPVDAAFRAIESIAKSESELQLYSVNNITSGTDAQGEVTVRLQKDGRIVNGQGADTDIVVASAKAYIGALNKLKSGAERLNPQL
nr:alpha-isopropylmalate synthase regulatory domain-containing protein [Burkholderiales bacterium]